MRRWKLEDSWMMTSPQVHFVEYILDTVDLFVRRVPVTFSGRRGRDSLLTPRVTGNPHLSAAILKPCALKGIRSTKDGCVVLSRRILTNWLASRTLKPYWGSFAVYTTPSQ